MKVAAIIQARMSSHRLPGKALREVAGRPLIQYVIERLERCAGVERIVVATSTGEDDDAIARFCEHAHVDCHRGPLENVAARFAGALERFDSDAFVRVCADSPLLDPALVDRGIDIFRAGRWELVTNVSPRSFPPGQSVEVVDSAMFQASMPLMAPADTEHVTSHFYRHAERFCIENFAAVRGFSDLRLVVDTQADLERFSMIVESMARPHWEYGLDELVELAERVTAPSTFAGVRG